MSPLSPITGPLLTCFLVSLGDCFFYLSQVWAFKVPLSFHEDWIALPITAFNFSWLLLELTPLLISSNLLCTFFLPLLRSVFLSCLPSPPKASQY